MLDPMHTSSPRKSAPAVLLVETSSGETVAVRFPSVDAAREWEDAHEGALTVVGAPRLVSRKEALS